MGISQRRKGASGEREVCRLLADHWGIKAERNLDQVREGGCDIPVPPYHIEVKRRARIGNIYDWMAQAEASCAASDRPIVFCRGDGKEWLVVMKAEEFLKLGREESLQTGMK
jgi:hypothetical protein